jgi:uncharacterized protein YndB with AHSA1/START domain
MKKEALRVTATIPVAPTTLYFAWIDSAHHSAMTGGTAKIDPNVGAKFTAWIGYITGKLVILDLGRRIVMSWRTSDFPRDASDSRVEVHFESLGTSTRILILHTDIPEGQAEKYKQGWMDKYINPMRVYFSKYLPDPRNPPVRRPPPPPPEDEEQEEEEEEAPKAKAKGKLAAKAAPPAKPSAAAVKKPGPSVAKVEAKLPAKAPAAKAAKKAAPPPKPAKKAPPPKPAKKAPPPKPAKKAPPPKPAKKPAAKPAKKAPAKPAKKK